MLLKCCIFEGECIITRHRSNKIKHFKWTRKTSFYLTWQLCRNNRADCPMCVWLRRDFSKDSNGHLQCKTRSSTLPSPLPPCFRSLSVVERQIQEQCGLSYLLKVYIPSLLKQVGKQPLLRKAIPDLTPGAPARSVCAQTTSLTVAFLYINTSGLYETHSFY